MNAVNPTGLGGEALDAVRNTIGGAATIAAQQPAAVGAELLATSREAFTHGLQVAALSGAAAMVVVAAIVAVLLRKVPIETGEPIDPYDIDAPATVPSPKRMQPTAG